MPQTDQTKTPLGTPVPPESVIVRNPDLDRWIERAAIDHCTDPDRTHGASAIPCIGCLRWARDMAARRCYGCGIVVLDGQGEAQGRAGWVHTDCMEPGCRHRYRSPPTPTCCAYRPR